jgi:hypothetical protein
VSTTTNAQLAQMLHEDEQARRRARFQAGISVAQHGTRIEGKRRDDLRGNKGNQRAAFRGEF